MTKILNGLFVSLFFTGIVLKNWINIVSFIRKTIKKQKHILAKIGIIMMIIGFIGLIVSLFLP